MQRREFIQVLAAGAGAGILPGRGRAQLASGDDPYDFAARGDLRIIHTCDTHAQLLPVFYREASSNLGFGDGAGRPPHLVGDRLLAHYGIEPGSRLAHALSHIDFSELAGRFGAVGGFAHLATLIGRLRAGAPGGAAVHLDSGDLWQGSYTALATQGQDMVEAANLLGIDAMTGHWEFTYPADQIARLIGQSRADFVAQNVFLTEEAQFDDAPAFDSDSGRVFPPYVIKEAAGRRIAVIGQAFPHTAIANPQRFIPDWTFGIRAEELQEVVDQVRSSERPDLVVLISHNGHGLDIALASRLRGIDLVLGGHTHDAMPRLHRAGDALVASSGSCGKFVSVLDVSVAAGGGIDDIGYRLLPVFSGLLPADRQMESLIGRIRAPHEEMLGERLAVADEDLYRRGNFSGTFDQVMVDALRSHYDAQLALSPGFRWGTSVPAGSAVTMEHVMSNCATTYPETYVREMTGETVRMILEDVADNLYNRDPFYRQGGDMVRVGGFSYALEPGASAGSRISDLRLSSGEPMAADAVYRVAGWATVGEQSPGPPVWEIVADHLRGQQRVALGRMDLPRLIGVDEKNGIQDYPRELMT